MRVVIANAMLVFIVGMPLALLALYFGFPLLLDVLGALFQFMRDFAAAVKG